MFCLSPDPWVFVRSPTKSGTPDPWRRRNLFKAFKAWTWAERLRVRFRVFAAAAAGAGAGAAAAARLRV